MCFYVRSLCCCCVSCMHCVRRRVAMLSIMSLLPSYTHTKKNLRVLLPVVHRRSRTRWGFYMWYQSGFNPRLGIATDFVDMI
jgi:hypothetical protein